jgi:hypothetical protein
MNDLKFALRQLRKTPGFTLIAVATLALGIGLNTAIFSLINDLFLRGLPFREPARVLHVFSKFKDQRVEFPLSAPRFYHFRDGQAIFDGFACENGLAATVTGLGDAFQVPIFKATANWFDVLGVRATRGRTFLPEEEEGADVAVITDRFWKARLGSDPNVIGRALVLDGVTHTIVGVIPKLPVSWTECRHLDDEAIRHSWFFLRPNDARDDVSARGRATESGCEKGASIRCVAGSREWLSRAISRKDRCESRHSS